MSAGKRAGFASQVLSHTVGCSLTDEHMGPKARRLLGQGSAVPRSAPDGSAGALEVATEEAIRTIRILAAFDAEAEDAVADPHVRRTARARVARHGALADLGAAALAGIAVAVGDALDAAVARGVAPRAIVGRALGVNLALG